MEACLLHAGGGDIFPVKGVDAASSDRQGPGYDRNRDIRFLSTAPVFFLFLSPFQVNRSTIATPARIKFIPVFISDLTSGFASTVLPAFDEARVQIGANDTFIEFGSANVFHAVQRFLVGVIFDKAEAARCLLESIQAHDETFDLTAPAHGQSCRCDTWMLWQRRSSAYFEKSSWICSSVV